MPVQNKPIIHGRDHHEDGADPIKGLLPAIGGDYEGVIRALTGLIGYWRLGESSGPWADTSGVDGGPHDMVLQSSGGTVLTANVTGALPASIDDGAVQFNYAGTGAETAAQHLRTGATSFFTQEQFTAVAFINITEPGATNRGEILGSNAHGVGGAGRLGWALQMTHPLLVLRWTIGEWGGSERYAESPTGLAEDTWYHVAGTYDNEELKLYINGTLVDSTVWDNSGSPVGLNDGVWIGYQAGNFEHHWFPGVVDEAAAFNRALTAGEIASLYQAGIGGTGGPGQVVVIDPITGEPIWAPPGTEVEHGDGDEQENPSTGPSAGGATNGSGWHYEDHFEYVVLYDSNPGRFDVPSRKWVRVPFNTVRIQRRWETEPGLFMDAWLPDDRGLTEHAKNGVLLVTPGMTFGSAEQEISGWFSIEYPMLDGNQLPNPGGGSPDRYVRAARMTNTTNGSVLRTGGSVDLSYRNFFEWPFSSPAGGDEGRIYFQSDNPYPLYPNSPGRPLNKPLPYPKKTSADSLDDYQLGGIEGFGLGYFTSLLNLDAGAAISLQAWQDSPWPLRFGTDKYPPFTAQNYRETWRKRPALVLYHRYDPDTVDHDTGLLI